MYPLTDSFSPLGNVGADYSDYLRDESRRVGKADSISFPASEEAIREALAWASQTGAPVTTQGARTGITGGATPDGGHILNLSRMNRMLALRADQPPDQGTILSVQPGVLLRDVNQAASDKRFDATGWSNESMAAARAIRHAPGRFLFAPDLTETTASVGGLTACNGSGARSYVYGATRAHVAGLRVVLADGSILELPRGRCRAKGRAFEVETTDGRTIRGRIPGYTMPHVKNAAGYFAEDEMDLVDAFVGSEGTLGVFSRIDIRLIPAPAARWGITVFLPGEDEALALVRQARGKTCAVAIEFMNHGALDLLRRQKAANPAFAALPELPAAWHTAVYVEYHGDNEDQMEEQVALLSEIIAGCGGNEEATWLATSEQDIERFKVFRHAIPEAVNLSIDERRRIDARITKLGTDLSVPDEALERVMAMYRNDLAARGLDAVSFGHIGNNHVHVNIIPRSMEEHAAGKDLYMAWARAVVGMGGSVSAEHGIGKLKTAMLEVMYGQEGVRQMRELKRVFDPAGILNRGNLFAWEP